MGILRDMLRDALFETASLFTACLFIVVVSKVMNPLYNQVTDIRVVTVKCLEINLLKQIHRASGFFECHQHADLTLYAQAVPGSQQCSNTHWGRLEKLCQVSRERCGL